MGVDSEELASEILEDYEEDLKQMFGTEVTVVEAKEAAEEKTSEDELQLQAQENHFLFSAAVSDVTVDSSSTAASAEELKPDDGFITVQKKGKKKTLKGKKKKKKSKEKQLSKEAKQEGAEEAIEAKGAEPITSEPVKVEEAKPVALPVVPVPEVKIEIPEEKLKEIMTVESITEMESSGDDFMQKFFYE